MIDDLQWYFEARRTPPVGRDQRFDLAGRAFRAPRFRALYRAWLERGDRGCWKRCQRDQERWPA